MGRQMAGRLMQLAQPAAPRAQEDVIWTAGRQPHHFQSSNTRPSVDQIALTPFPFRRVRFDLSATELAALPAADAVADLAECATPGADSCPRFLNAAAGGEQKSAALSLGIMDAFRLMRRDAQVAPGKGQATTYK